MSKQPHALDETLGGWHVLIDLLLAAVEHDRGTVFQIKEKFGLLRFYADGVSERTLRLIGHLENASAYICEKCGKPGHPRDNHWIKTLCDTHATEMGYGQHGAHH